MTAGCRVALTPHIDIEWLDGQTGFALCPNCGALGTVPRLLDIRYCPPDPHEDEHRFVMQSCPSCAVRFVDNAMMMDYSTERLIQLGWDSYQVQLGAGIWPIAAQLAALDKPAGAKVLEIGGAFGFGLDFCIRARGWDGVGYDPSPLAAFGTQELGLPLCQEYFTVRHLELGPWDVAVATELIEHVSYPVAFLLIMRRALGDTGVLILSTPDAAHIAPETPASVLLPLLSPGAHAVLQTRQSLEMALRAAGFTHIRIVADGTSLVAYASAAPFDLLRDQAARRALYRRYLVERARSTPELGDLRLGFAGRGIFEAANDGDWAAADAAWAALLPAVRARFGLDLETMAALPPRAAEASLSALCQLMPLGLGMILFGRAMRRLAAGESRAALEPMLRLAAAAVAALLDALARRSLMDGLSASLAVLLRTELLICAAAAGRAEAVAGLVALGDEATGWRGFVELVNAGAIAPATALRAALPAMPGAAIPPGLARNALLSLVNFHLAPGADALLVFAAADRLHDAGEAAEAPRLLGFTRLVNAGRNEAARDIALKYDIAALARNHAAQKSGQDAAVALAMLALAVGDPAAIGGVLAACPLSPAQSHAVLLEAFVRLVNAGRYDDATGFSAAHDVPGLVARVEGEAARNTRLALVDLDLATGDPAAIPARLEGLALAPQHRAALLLQAFIRLTNAARHDTARAFAATHDVPDLIRRQSGVMAADAALSLAVLELAAGDAALVPALLAAHEIDPARRAGLILGSFTTLVNAGRHDEAEALMTAEPVLQNLDQQNLDQQNLDQRAGAAAGDARWAALMLDLQRGRALQAARRAAAWEAKGGDAARLAGIYVDGFIRLVNAGAFAAARELPGADGLERRIASCAPAARLDALAARLMLDAHPDHGDAEAVPQRLAALRAAGMDETRLTDLGFHAFSMLVNQAAFTPARLVLLAIEPALIKLRPLFSPVARDALFAAGILYLQSEEDWPRGAGTFARLRDGLVKQTPRGQAADPLFWPALRGEVITLHRLDRGAEATSLLQSFMDAYPGAPDDLRHQLEG
ncbi:class I SAM-dependent methyltransferase [Acidocella sp.]|uniref:class I SAM-dependent methyltransferase n=1 Tax=Acidocella sp. TaxID=50710 RepID=UPI002632DCDB|nr:class I SAM-dependent methyltransferase [Acidocella sp.]